MGVSDCRVSPLGKEVLVADARAADQRSLPVDDRTFLRQTQIRERHSPRQRRMQEATNGTALPAQVMKGGGAHKTAAKTINQNAGSYPPATRSGQRPDEL